MSGRGRSTVWVMSELYHPEVTSTGHYMTLIAERLAADGRDVAVLCGQPTYGARGTRAAGVERRNGVTIRRCGGTTFDKDNLAGRAVNIVTLSMSTLWSGLRRVRRGDLVIAVTNPPTMPWIAMLVATLRRARFVPLFHDVLPVVLEVAGGRPAGSLAVGIARSMTAIATRRADTIVVVGRPLVTELERYGHAADVVVIPNWSDDADVVPVAPEHSVIRRELGLVRRRVALYAGTFGRANDLEIVLGAAALLARRDDITIVLCGDGPQRASIERRVGSGHSENVVIAGPYPRDRQSDMYGAGDVVVVPLLAGMGRSSMPSRTYNSLAAGCPVIACTEPDSELALLIGEHGVGAIAPAGDAPALARAIEGLLDDPELPEVAARARDTALGACSTETALSAWSALVARLLGDAR